MVLIEQHGLEAAVEELVRRGYASSARIDDGVNFERGEPARARK